jgi:hypothetical protein
VGSWGKWRKSTRCWGWWEKKKMNIIELFAKNRRKSGGLHRIPMLIYGRQQVDVERKGVWRLRKMYASCKGGSNRRNERSLFNRVFIFGCYMTPFVSLGVGTLDVCLCFLHFKSFSFILVFVSFTLVWLVSVAPCRSPLLLHRFSIFFGYVISHNFIREYFF